VLNRRLIRIKVFQAYYAAKPEEGSAYSISQAESFLSKSLEGIEEAFYAALLFPYELKHFMEMEYKPGSQSQSSESERKKCSRLLLKLSYWERLEKTLRVRERIDKPRYNWSVDQDFLRLMVKNFILEPFVVEAIENNGVKDEMVFIQNMYEYFIQQNEDFMQQFEEMHMHWEDERHAVMQSIKKILKQESSDAFEIPDISPDWEDDSSFARSLLKSSLENEDEFTSMIAEFTPDWETERIARADRFMMIMALCELIYFPYIPVKVTLNEYLELAKRYSTPQSSKFINGVLDKILKKLQAENRVIKKGRGLLG
jgi:N utilization substance protein B